jgi:hypothetical protein
MPNTKKSQATSNVRIAAQAASSSDTNAVMQNLTIKNTVITASAALDTCISTPVEEKNNIDAITLDDSSFDHTGFLSLLEYSANLKKLSLINCQVLPDSQSYNIKDLLTSTLEELFIINDATDDEVNTSTVADICKHLYLSRKKISTLKCLTMDLSRARPVFNDIVVLHMTLKALPQLEQLSLNIGAAESMIIETCRDRGEVERCIQRLNNRTKVPSRAPLSTSTEQVSQTQAELLTTTYGLFQKISPFSYQRVHDLSQHMVIKQLSQYLVIIKGRPGLIECIQQGICQYLAAWHHKLATQASKNPSISAGQQILEKLEQLRSWDGTEEKLTPAIEIILKELVTVIETDDWFARHHFHGDTFMDFLLSTPGTYILGNNFHATSVEYHAETQRWIFYDCNFPEGPALSLTPDELNSKIFQQLSVGTNKRALYIAIRNEPPKTEKFTIDTNHFIQHGGLLNLTCSNYNSKAIFLCLQPAEEVPIAALEGLLCYHENTPVWVHSFFRVPPSDILNYILDLLERFVQADPDNINRLIDSLKETHRSKISNTLSPLAQRDGLNGLYDALRSHLDTIYRQSPKTFSYTENTERPLMGSQSVAPRNSNSF